GRAAGPPIAVRWAGRRSAPLPARLQSERPLVLLLLAVPMAEPRSAVRSMAVAPPCIAVRPSSPRGSATVLRQVRQLVLPPALQLVRRRPRAINPAITPLTTAIPRPITSPLL